MRLKLLQQETFQFLWSRPNIRSFTLTSICSYHSLLGALSIFGVMIKAVELHPLVVAFV